MGNTRKEPVRIRTKKLANGNLSLYLDIYYNQKRTYEFLSLYLIPEKTKADKKANEQTIQLAEAIKAKRIVDIKNHRFGFSTYDKSSTNFYDYYCKKCEERLGVESRGNWGNWMSALQHLSTYDKQLKKRTFKDIDVDYINGFRDYLEKTARRNPTYNNCDKDVLDRGKDNPKLARNTCASYFNKFLACLKEAYDEHILFDNPLRGISRFKPEEGTRMYLTLDELKRLTNARCRNSTIRNAFLFSCLSGLRRSDIEKLTWGEVHEQGEFTRIIFKQKKTKGVEYLDIPDDAVELMGERKDSESKVFGHLHCTDYTNTVISEWCEEAGINKKITFHCGRHTFATLMLDLGTDIYTVSKLLGHRDIETTQIYAKVLDKNKQEAIKRIPKLL